MTMECATIQRIMRRVDKKSDGCWIWQGALDRDGYGWVRSDGKVRRAHRVLFELLRGPIDGGLPLDHLCRVRNCVNPEHLEPVTHRENILRGIGLCARNAVATHCPSGHPYDSENTIYRVRNGKSGRSCRRCKKLSERSRRARLRSALLREAAVPQP